MSITERAPASDSVRQLAAPSGRKTLRAVVRRGLLDQRRAVLAWGLSLGAFGAFLAAVYPSIRTSVQQIARNYPAGLKEAFGVQTLSTVEGYLHAEMFSLIVPLAVSYFVIRTVCGGTVGAEERGELDTVLALPVSRTVLLVGNCIIAAVASAGILALIGVLILIGGGIAGSGVSLGLLCAGVAGVWPLGLFFGGIAALGCGALHSARLVSGGTLAILLAMYALDVVGRLSHALEPLRWISAFRYYDAPLRDGLDPASFFGLVAVGMLLVLAGTVLFERRDVLH